MYHDESWLKQKLQVCKQQQTASGNKYLMIFVPDKSSLKHELHKFVNDNKQPQAIKCCFSYNCVHLSTLEWNKNTTKSPRQ